jgi:murein DD-endopeptidase MepM/ murein hydrolase activator NlpD
VSRNPIFLILAAVLSALAALSLQPAHYISLATRCPPPTRIDLIAWAQPDYASQLPFRPFGWPLPGSPTVVRSFQPLTFPYGPGHRGVDLAAAAGEPVLATGDGTVVFAGVVAGREVLSLSHLGGLRTTYEPASAIVTAGQRVSKGEQIGTVRPGHPACPVAVCLHWGAFRAPAAVDPGRHYLDPLQLVFPSRVRLLPIEDPPDRS